MKIKHLVIFLFIGIIYPQTKTLISFKIEDQFERVYTNDSFDKELLFFFVADRKGSEFSPIWNHSIKDLMSSLNSLNKIELIPVANLGSVPFFLKGFVAGKFPEDSTEWSLMDWDSIFEEEYKVEEDKCHLLVFNKERQLFMEIALDVFSDKKLDSIITRVEMELNN